jgi:hypothetical protein
MKRTRPPLRPAPLPARAPLLGRTGPLALTLALLAPLAMAAPLAAQSQSQTDRAQTDRAQTDRADKPEKPVTQREPNAVDVVTTPASDLNLKKDEIPPLLIAAQNDPYGLAGMRRCADLSRAVRQFDAVLGDDFDVAQAKGTKLSAGRVAQSVVGSFIPFRGIIREVSGANAQERRLQTAVYAGSARRAFLKGVGLQRGCPWPARPAM